ncbi:MAG TPA: SpaA isopeptide-forming pilin-related protein [Nocardioidaceae bacterium]|nr:SpaA isopeptide-forming pilin-related protein [Nocardioidaceae bacterium]
MAQQDFTAGLMGRRHRRLGSVVRISTALALSVLSLPLLSAPADALTTLPAIDGAPSGTAAYTDQTGHNDDIYKSSKEDGAPTAWIGGSGLVDTGSDVTSVYYDTAIDTTSGDLWFYLGYARTEAGVATGVVELNQLPDVDGANGGVKVPDRSPGDLRITFTQNSGGSPFTEYAVQRWTGSTWGQAVTLPSASYQSDTGTDGLFAEFSIDLSAIGLAPACDESFTQINMRTRSSDKNNAELKDYVPPISVQVQARCRAIEVQKYDATTNEPLPGAQFQLYADSNGNGNLDLPGTPGTTTDAAIGGPVTTDQSDGSSTVNNAYTWKDLPWGTYFVKETSAPAGYLQDPKAVQNVTLDVNTGDNGTAYAKFYNRQMLAGIQVLKLDKTTGDPLTGAKFQLWEDNGDGVFNDNSDTKVGTEHVASQAVGSSTVGNTYTWSGLRYGTYFVQETQAPAGYALDTTAVQKVQLAPADGGTTKTVSFEDAALTPTIVVSKHDANGNPVAGAGFTLWKDDGNGTFDATADTKVTDQVWADQGTDRNSYTWNRNLDWGTYFVQETTTPAGYGTDPAATNDVKKVELPKTTPVGVATIDFADPRLTSSIKVRKFDFDTHNPLPGATFTLYTDDNQDGTLDAGDQQIPGSRQAADNGPDGNTATWSGLAWGQDYLVAETTTPPGYDTDLSAVNGAKLVQLTKADGGTTVTVNFFDPKTKAAQNPGTINVFKTDVYTGDAVDGATFRLYLDLNGDGKPQLTELRYSDPPRLDKGTYQWQVEPGDYLVEEATPPPGYTLPTDAVQAVTVGSGGNETVRFADAQKLSTITVTKTDADTHAKLDGATFTLTDDTGKSFGGPDSTANGSYTWTDLRMGDYTVTETAPPPGYTLPATVSQDVDLDGDDAGSTAQLTFEDTQKLSTIVVHKYDEATNVALDGASFTLTDTTGKSWGAPKTSGKGTYTWTDLPMGGYTVTETAPPPGYLPPDQDSLPAGASQDALFDASSAGGTAVLDFYDEARPAPPPPPGTPGTDLVVTKVDQISGDPLDTATFQLYGDDGDGTFTEADQAHGAPQQTSDGQVTWNDLPVGTYFVQETASPQGYGKAAPLTVVIDASQSGQTIRRDVADPRLQTTLQVLKADDVTDQPLAGATFRVFADGNSNGRVDTGEKQIGTTQTTDAHGLTSWDGLGFGSYLVEETAAPDGYDLPADHTMSVVVGRGNAGGVLQVVFLDPAQSGFAIVKAAMEKTADGQWVPSDGSVAFGDLVKYVITVGASGSRTAHAVQVSDFVPGYAPEDTESTGRSAYVDGSAACTGTPCTTSYDAGSGRLEWSLGDLAGGTSRRVSFVVRMPDLPAHPTYVKGVYTETVVNVADVTWQQESATTARATGYLARTMRSNAVRTDVVDAPQVLHIPPAHRPHDSGGPGLPNTGAPAHTGMITLLGWLSVLCGGWLVLRRPRRQDPTQP